MSEFGLGEWIAAGIVVLVLFAIALRGLLAVGQKRQMERARRLFRQQRERLEARFFDIAAGSGKPRGLRWTDIDFADEVCFARDRKGRFPLALVATTISFEAIEGGDMEEVEAVSNLRAATAVFYLDGRHWSTRGRVLFNLEPTEAIERLESVMEQAGD
jgi:hypothetical protein